MAISQIEREIGERLKFLLDHVKKGKKEFSNSLGINESQFTRIIKGAAGISIETIMDISSKYNVRLEWLLKEDGPIFNEKSGSLQEPDFNLLTQMKKQFDELKVNFDKLTESLPVPPQGKKAQTKEFERIAGDTRQKADKR